MPVSFVVENLSCEFALVNRSSKISGNLVSGPLLVHVFELLCWLQSDYSWLGHSVCH